MEQPTTASEIRELYNNTLTETENYNRQLGEKVQIVDMGDTQKKIEESFQLISQLTRTDNPIRNRLRRWLPASIMDKASDKIAEKSVEGRSVADVSKDLLEALISKKAKVEDVFSDLYELHDSITEVRQKLHFIVEGIDEKFEEFDAREKVLMTALKGEVLEQINYHEQNIVNSQGALHAAESTIQKLSQVLPSIRARVTDGLAIRGALKELDQLSTLTDDIQAACEVIQGENTRVMTEQVTAVIDRMAIKDSTIKAISDNRQQMVKTSKLFQDKITQAHAQQMKKVEELSSVVQHGVNFDEVVRLTNDSNEKASK